jgi:hypothetical protein
MNMVKKRKKIQMKMDRMMNKMKKKKKYNLDLDTKIIIVTMMKT